MNKEKYGKMVEEFSPKSRVFLNCVKAFFVGGFICLAGEAIRNVFLKLDFSEVDASCLVSIILIILAQIFTGVCLYEKLAKHAGAGLSVPITGFANAVVSPAMEYHTEGLVLGTGAKLFTISGPVIVYGTVASVIAGFIYYLKELMF